jgi:hypothetical protein
MTLKQKLGELGFKQYQIAKDLHIDKSVVYHFVAKRRRKVGKQNRRLIRRWLIEHNIVTVKHRPRCTCPHCGRVHLEAIPFRCTTKSPLLLGESEGEVSA